jgi:hypothetical protein
MTLEELKLMWKPPQRDTGNGPKLFYEKTDY